MPFDIDDYVFIDDDNDRVLEERGYRDDEPAIEYADGFALPEVFANYIRTGRKLLELWPASRAFFSPR